MLDKSKFSPKYFILSDFQKIDMQKIEIKFKQLDLAPSVFQTSLRSILQYFGYV